LLRGPCIVVTPAGLNIRTGGRHILDRGRPRPRPDESLPLTVRGPELALSARRPVCDRGIRDHARRIEKNAISMITESWGS
jgi:hypothetical protein